MAFAQATKSVKFEPVLHSSVGVCNEQTCPYGSNAVKGDSMPGTFGLRLRRARSSSPSSGTSENRKR